MNKHVQIISIRKGLFQIEVVFILYFYRIAIYGNRRGVSVIHVFVLIMRSP